MQIFLLLITLCIIASITDCSARRAPWKKNPKLDGKWASFKTKQRRNYRTQQDEDHRRQIFEEHDDFIERFNNETRQGKHSFEVGHNEYSDLSTAEFNAVLNGFRILDEDNSTDRMLNTLSFAAADRALPNYVDWRYAGYVTPVKDQGQCGSCYSFSAMGALEGQYFKKTGKLINLSEQNVVDCDTSNGGCNGGDPAKVYQYVINNNGIDTTASYPYKAVKQSCAFKAANVGAKAVGKVYLPAGDEAALTTAIANIGPIAVAIDAGRPSFQLYKSGLYTDSSCSKTINHAVLAVGYSATANGEPYYIVKNSWGTSWGQAGYVWMPRNAGNRCGIASYATYPTV